MSHQQDSSTEIVQRTFTWRRSALHDIHHAIGRAKRRPKSAIRVSCAAFPERKTWYECTHCGCEVYREDSRGKHCRLCGSMAVEREWVRPDIARALERARWWRARFSAGRGRYVEIVEARPWKPLPEGEYRIIRKSRGPG